jgi:hypothetical protein
MSFVFEGVANAAADSASVTIASGSRAATAGNLIVGCAVCQVDTPGAFSVSDTAGNTFEYGTARQHSVQPLFLRPFYARNITANAANVITADFTSSVRFRSIVWHEYSGVGVSTCELADDDVGETLSGATALSTPTLTLARAGVVVGLLCPYGTRTFTTTNTERYDPASYYLGSLDRIEGSAGSYALDATWSGAIESVMSALAFQLAGGGGGEQPETIFVPRRRIIRTRRRLSA